MSHSTELRESSDRDPGVESPEPTPSWHRLYFVWLTRVALVVGVVLRIVDWARNRSLWLDEIAVGQNIVERGFSALVKPLAADQAAPIAWLWSERLAVDVFGTNERVLRLVPLLASLIALAAFPALARRLVGPLTAPVATVLFATSPRLIYYASETKQYSSDVATVVLVLLISSALVRVRPSVRSGLVWGVAVSVLCWFSFPAIFVAGLSGLVLAGRWIRTPRTVLNLLPGGALLIATVGVDYQVQLRRLSKDTLLDRYWSGIGGYPPRPHTTSSTLHWVYRATVAALHDPAQLALPILVLVLGLIGALTLVRSRPAETALICVPLLVGVVLAATDHYPLYKRLALYLVPSMLLLLAAGAVGVAALCYRLMPTGATARPIVTSATALLAVVLLLLTAGSATTAGIAKLTRSDEVESGREAVAFIAAHRKPGDLVLVEAPWGLANLNFYGPRLGVRGNGTFSWAGRTCPTDPLGRLIQARARVWVLFGHRGGATPVDRADIFLSHFLTDATLEQSYTGAGQTGAYLVDFARRPATEVTARPTWVPHTCFAVQLNR